MVARCMLGCCQLGVVAHRAPVPRQLCLCGPVGATVLSNPSVRLAAAIKGALEFSPIRSCGATAPSCSRPSSRTAAPRPTRRSAQSECCLEKTRAAVSRQPAPCWPNHRIRAQFLLLRFTQRPQAESKNARRRYGEAANARCTAVWSRRWRGLISLDAAWPRQRAFKEESNNDDEAAGARHRTREYERREEKGRVGCDFGAAQVRRSTQESLHVVHAYAWSVPSRRYLTALQIDLGHLAGPG